LLFVDETLYQWRLLESHIAACFYTGRKEEANENYKEIVNIMKKNPNYFTQEEMMRINSNAQHFM